MSRRAKLPKNALDQGLVGRWQLGSTVYVIDPDGWYLIADGPRGFTVSVDGNVLDFAGENPPVPFMRTYGSGSMLVGVWARTLNSDGFVYVEELTFRSDGSMSSYWTKDGQFESNSSGRFAVNGNQVTREERYAFLTTTAPDQIAFLIPFGADELGSYSIAADGNSWTLVLGGVPRTYTKIP
jgi:hypothetical protein